MQFPFLSVIIFTRWLRGAPPVVSKDRKDEVRVTAALPRSSRSRWRCISLCLRQGRATVPVRGNSSLGAVARHHLPRRRRRHRPDDGAAHGLVIFTGSLVSWGIQDRPREFYALLMILVSGVFGVFVSARRLFAVLLLRAGDLSDVHPHRHVGLDAQRVRRDEADAVPAHRLDRGARRLAGDLFCRADANVRPERSGPDAQDGTFMFTVDLPLDLQVNFETLWFLPVFLGFGVLAGIWPFHNWSPDGHWPRPPPSRCCTRAS